MQPKEILQYQTEKGKCPFRIWFLSLKDIVTRASIRARLDRLSLGNFGDCKPVGEGVLELRLHLGPGYRIYFGMDRNEIIVLLSGGDKSRQQSDIDRAKVYWKDYLRRR